ncbi:MAG TPA: DUF805 domain-containing protein [Longimicrobiales bacterium]|nr:DUF805 domain-containing protein [Longimicrobiales bacterium]
MTWYLAALKRYAEFNGRSRRKEYWFFALFNVIFMFTLALLDVLLNLGGAIGLLGFVYSLGMLIPSLAVAFRRLHDVGRSAWWLLIGVIPIIGPIVLLVWMFQDSQPGANQWGPNPKARSRPASAHQLA